MKKIMFVVPLLTLSFVASCNKKSVSNLPIKCHCYIYSGGSLLLTADESFEYNDKGLLIKDTYQYVQGDAADINEYEYDEKRNITKKTITHIEGGMIVGDPDVTECTYIYDEKDRITKKVEKNNFLEGQSISDYTYESDLVDWKTFKYSSDEGGGAVTPKKNVTRTFKDGLYQTATDSITDEHYYYTWDEYRCNIKIEIYNGEGKTPDNHYSDETFEYHKNMSNKIKKHVTTYYEGGEIEGNETYLTEYDEHDRMIKISKYYGQVINSYREFEYKD